MRRLGAVVLAAAAVLAGVQPAQATVPSIADACPEQEVRPEYPFLDRYDSSHTAAIECVAWWGVAGGVDRLHFGVAGQVTRGQMASFLARTLDALRVPLPEGPARFADVAGSTHERNIHRLAAAGVALGGADGRYRPAEPVTRGQVASLLLRTYRQTGMDPYSPGWGSFDDDDGSPHEAAIDTAAWQGWATGVAPRTFAPDRPVRRDQMASFLARMIDTVVRNRPGSRANPVPLGQPVAMANGWRLQLLEVDPDAAGRVVAADPRNTPPSADRRYLLVRVRATNGGPAPSRAGTDHLQLVPTTPYDWETGWYSPANAPCGVLPDPLPDVEVPAGGAVEGELCFSLYADTYPPLVLRDLRLDVRSRAWGLVHDLPGTV